LLTPSTNYDNSRRHDEEKMRGGRQGSAEVSEWNFLCLEKAGWREVDEDPKMHFPSPRVGEVPRLRQSGRKRKLKVPLGLVVHWQDNNTVFEVLDKNM